MMEQTIDYEKAVKAVYSDAIFWRLSPNSLMGAIFDSGKSRLKLTNYTTEQKAWKQAYDELPDISDNSDTDKRETYGGC